MSQITYCVYTTFQDPSLADEWLGWLRDGHIAEVIAGGASDAEIIELDVLAPGTGRAFEVRYHFPSRGHFEQYERDAAPRLRAEGLTRFPVQKGVSYRRAVGVTLAQYPARSGA